MELVIGWMYNWINEDEKLRYKGESGGQHQFSLMKRDSDNMWCEDSSCHITMFEEAEKSMLENSMKNKPSVPQTPFSIQTPEEALRDAFAGKAMQALLAKPNTLRGSDLAIAAYSIADAMMKERIK